VCCKCCPPLACQPVERFTLTHATPDAALPGVPHKFCYCLRETSMLTGLPVPMLRRMARDREIVANKTNGWWMIRRPQLLRLLPARCSTAY
jgi:hypothetical protein